MSRQLQENGNTGCPEFFSQKNNMFSMINTIITMSADVVILGLIRFLENK